MRSTSKVIPLGRIGRVVPLCLLALAAAVMAQTAPSLPAAAPAPKAIGAYANEIYQGMKAVMLRAAEVMPEADYNSKPVDTVRTFGQILGHIADSQYFFVSVSTRWSTTGTSSPTCG